jgi:Sensors of blue-light using FAD
MLMVFAFSPCLDYNVVSRLGDNKMAQPPLMDQSGLRSVVYTSMATQKMTPKRLEALLIKARELNRKNSITGVLLYADGKFLQCLEGPEAFVLSTYERIRNSRQHTDIAELMNRAVSQRGFKGWEMGLARPTKSELLTLSTARWKGQQNPEQGPDMAPVGFELLRVFWQQTPRDH